MKNSYLCLIMKKIRSIRILTFVAVSVLLLLQGIWIANVYRLLQKQLSVQINEVFIICANKDLMIRMESDTATDGVIGSIKSDTTGVLESYELVFQEYLSKKLIFTSLSNLDSIFHSEIAKHNIHGTFIINRINPQTGEIVETTDSLGKGKLQGAMASEIIPIRMDGSEGVQVLLVSPYRALFRQMMFILSLSLLLVLFIGYAFFFLLRSFITEKRLREFQTDFSHALVHNMATPLGTIAQINNLMTNDAFVADADKRKKYAGLARQQILNLQALTDRILTVARSEQSRLVPKTEEIDLVKEIGDMVNSFSTQSKKEVHFSTHFYPQTISFAADRAMLTNAIGNLIDNAIKYSGQSVKIAIHCRLTDDGLLISIKDNGYGISKKDQQVIFAKFERGAAVSRKEAKGFGLGLAYVKSVAEAHGGTVNLFSTKGEGTTFELFLPVFNSDTPFSIQFNSENHD